MIEVFHKIKKYNCWNGKLYDAGYLRSEYLERLTSVINNKLVKVLTGHRRAGKSYIIRQIINYLISDLTINPLNIFYVNKEYLAFDEIRTSDDLEELFRVYREQLSVTGKIYIFIDEVQNIKDWERFVNSYAQDFTQEYELFITGSNSSLLSGELASLLSGRFIEFNVYAFSLNEYTGMHKIKTGKQTFFDYLQSGGLPELYALKGEDLRQHYVESLKNTIILRDVVQRHNIKDAVLLEDIFKFIVQNIGNLTSLTSIVKYFKNLNRITNYETLSSYVSFLLDTNIIHEVERYNLKGKQVLSGERKYYLGDLAFINYLFGFKADNISRYLENFVFMQLKRMGFQVLVGVFDNLEIDFVAKKTNKTLYVQVAYLLKDQNTINREFGNLLKIKDNHEKIVVSLDDLTFSDHEGIGHLKPWELG